MEAVRTPTEIFEEVLDAWDDDVKAVLAQAPGPHLEQHRAKAAAYREEFRQAREAERGLVSGLDESKRLHEAIRIKVRELRPGESIDADGNRFLSHAQGAVLPPAEPVLLSAPEQALADANPSTYVPPEPTASAEEAFLGICSPVPSREPFFMSSEGIVKVAQVAAFGAGLVLPPGQPVKPPRVGPGDHNLRPPREPLSLTVSGPPPTLDAEILREPPPLREAFDDEEFRHRRDENAERYTRADGSPK